MRKRSATAALLKGLLLVAVVHLLAATDLARAARGDQAHLLTRHLQVAKGTG